jgi:uncharacterized membrane protein (GlpM family)
VSYSYEMKYLLYFLVGGTIVSLVTYFAGQQRGLLAAFFANLPSMTLITFLLIYFDSGEREAVLYARGLIIMLFPWLAYIFSVIFLSKRLGFIPALLVGVGLYLAMALAIMSAGIKGN